MYIGPWQEYKLAHVIKIKNNIYEGSFVTSPKLTEKAINFHNQRTLTTDSTSTDRSFVSEGIQRDYPKFNIDTFHKQWKRVEDMLTRSEANDYIKRKPRVPKPIERTRQPRSLQAQRVTKMRHVYGLPEKHEIKLPPIGKNNNSESINTFGEKPKEKLILPPINNHKVEEIEEDIEEQFDGLLQWVKELPEETSMGSSEINTQQLFL